MELQRKKYLLAYKSENIAPSPWALGNGGEKRNWKYSGHTKKSLRRELIQDTFPKDKICFGLGGVKFICEEIPDPDFHSCVVWGIGRAGLVFFFGENPGYFIYSYIKFFFIYIYISIPNPGGVPGAGIPFFGFCFLGIHHQGIGAWSRNCPGCRKNFGFGLRTFSCLIVCNNSCQNSLF